MVLERVNPLVAFVVGALVSAGATRAWYTEGDVFVPLGFLVFVVLLIFAGEFNHYLGVDSPDE